MLERRAANEPDRPAYSFLADGERVERTISYGALRRRAREVAAALRAHARSGDRVLVCAPGIEFIEAFFGCVYGGLIAVPAPPLRGRTALARLQAVVADATPSVVLADAATIPRLGASRVAACVLALDDVIESDAAAFREPQLQPDDIVLLQYTSGSTAAPKGVMVSHRNILHNERMIASAFSHDRRFPIVGWLPLHHDMGLIGNVLHALYAGAHSVLMPPERFVARPVRWLDAISRYGAFTSGAPNFAYELCVEKIRDDELGGLDLSGWSVAFNGAEPVRAETLDRFAARFAAVGFRRDAFVPCYGLAEATLFVAGGAPGRARAERAHVACGRTWDDLEIAIVDSRTRRRCAPGADGEIWLRSASTAHGYWQREKETREVFAAQLDGEPGDATYLRTGDLGFMSAGELYVTGRLKDLLVLRGRNYAPEDIERSAAACDPILRRDACAAVAVTVGVHERLVILQEVERGHDGVRLAEAIDAVASAIARDHQLVAHEIVLLRPGTLRRTSSGKPRRRVWRAEYLAGAYAVLARGAPAARGGGDADPGRVAALAATVARALGRAPASIPLDAPLSSLGLDSLALMHLALAIEEGLGTTVDLGTLFADLTLRELDEQLGPATSEPSARREPDTDEFGLSFTQHALWLLEQVDRPEGIHSLPFVARVLGDVDAAALERAFAEVVARHAMLRVDVTSDGGQPSQRVRAHERAVCGIVDASAWTEAELERRVREAAARPLALATDGPLSAQLFVRPGAPSTLVVRFHHLAADFWSIELVLDELARTYTALRRGERPVLPAPRATYAEFARRQTEIVAGADGARHLAYWRGALAGDLPRFPVPWDRSRPRGRTFAMTRRRFRLAALQPQLDGLARDEGTTIFVVLLTAFAALLARYADEREVVVGTVASGRAQPAFARVVGDFANPLPLRADLRGDPDVRAAVARLRRVVQGALAHQEYPFSALVERLGVEPDKDRFPLFGVVFLFQADHLAEGGPLSAFSLGEPGARLTLGELTLEAVSFDVASSPFDLAVRVAADGDDLVLAIDANDALFDGGTVERLAAHYRNVLTAVAADPALPVSAIPLLSADERDTIVRSWNATAAPAPDSCLHHLVEAQVARTPGAVALEFAGNAVTYAELNHRANQLAHYLRKRGVGPETMVGLCVERSVEMVVGLLGILKAGAAYVPLDPAYPATRLGFMIEETRIPVLLVQDALRGAFPPTRADVVRLDADWSEIARESGENPVSGVRPDNLAYVIYTSGSTGRAKGILLNHRALANQIRDSISLLEIGPRSRVLQFASFSFDASLWELLVTLQSGGTVCLARRDELVPGPVMAAWLRRHRVTLVLLSPSVLALLAPDDLPDLATVVAGTERCSGEVAARWSAGRRFFNAYGPTETTVFATLMACTGTYPQGPPIGRPLANMRAYILDRDRNPVPVGVPGKLYLGGAGLARGYLDRAELTACTFVPDPFSDEPGGRLYDTGDLARFLPDGAIEYLSRGDDQVKIRGLRIELGEIQAVLGEHPGVRDAIVVAREDAPGEKRLVAYALAEADRAPTGAELRAFLRDRLPPYMIPAAIVLLDALPLTPNNKVDVAALPPPQWNATHAYTPPVGPAEVALARIWEAVLGVDRVGADDDFFELGGDSIAGLQIVARARENGWQITARAIFEHPTVAELARVAQPVAAVAAPAFPLAAIDQDALRRVLGDGVPTDDLFPLSPLQRGLLFHTIERPESGVYFSQLDARLEGSLDLAALRAAWQAAVDRHEVLRATVIWEDVPRPLLRIHAAVELPWEDHDLRGVPRSQQDARVADILRADRARGFDLRRGPLIRATLLRLADDVWRLIWSHHHLVLDGWSLGVVLDEVVASYAGTTAAAAPVRPYREYIAWLERQDAAAAERHWRTALDGLDHATPLGIAECENAAGGLGAQRTARLDAATAGRLRAWARDRRLTLGTVVHGAWALVLGRWGGSRDVVFGVTAAGRPGELPGVTSMVGLFINTLPLRVRIPPHGDLDPWFADVQQRLIEHEQFGFSPLGKVRQWSPLPPGEPLFESIVAIENYPASNVLERTAHGVRFTVGDIHERNNYALSLAVHPGEELALRLSFDEGRFDGRDVEQVLASFEHVLRTLADGAPRRLEDLAFFAAPVHDVTWRSDAITAAADSAVALHRSFARQAASTPERTAIVCGAAQVTYRELHRRVAEIACELRALGVRADAIVGVCCERSVDMVVALLGALEAGAGYLALDPLLPDARLRELVADANPAAVLARRTQAERLRGAGARVVVLDEQRTGTAPPPRRDENVAHPDGLAYALYTSGSTGRPNGVLVPHGAAANHMAWMRSAGFVTARDRVLQRTPFHFDASVWELFAPLVTGAELVLIPDDEGMDPSALVRAVQTHRITVLQLVPTLLARLLDEPGIERCTTLARVFCGGEELTSPLVERFYGTLAADLYNLYGPTETTIDATFWRCERGDERRRIPIGGPIANVRVRVVDDALRDVPPGAAGEIVIGGAGLARGYLHRAALTAERFVPDPFARAAGARLYRTGDRGRRGHDGALEFLGRNDRQLKFRGLRIEPGEIESVLRAHPAVRDAVATVVDDGHPRLVAYVAPHTSNAQVAAHELRAFLRTRVPEKHVPAAFVVLPALPMLSNGKVDVRSLPPPPKGDGERAAPYAPSADSAEAALVAIWEQVLRVAPIGVNDDFFELGGDSILNLQVVGRARQAGLRITPKQVFEHPRIADLARVAEPLEAFPAQTISGGALALTPIQHWFLRQNHPKPSHFNQSVLLDQRRELGAELVEQALKAVVDRHDALHARFRRAADGWQADLVTPRAPLRVERLDVAELGADARAATIAAALARVQSGLDIEAGRLAGALVIEPAEDRPRRVLLVIHHLAVDVVSWHILLADLERCCSLLARGDAPAVAPASTSAAEWAEWLRQEADSAATRAEVPYWRAVTGGAVPVLPGGREPSEPETAAAARRHSVRLDPAETAELAGATAARLRARIPELVLSALAIAVRRAGAAELYVEIESHGRPRELERLDLSRTVGWLTATYPLRVEWPGGTAELDVLRAVKETWRAVPREGLAHGLLGAFATGGDADALRGGARPEIVFNYAGRFDGALPADGWFALAGDDAGPWIDPGAPRAHRFEVSAMIVGGRLRIDWTFGALRDAPERLAALAESMHDALRALIASARSDASAAAAPSDFPLAALDDAALRGILADGAPTDDLFPLSPVQQGLLVHSLERPGSGVYLTQLSCRLDGPLDVTALRAAWQDALHRHTILRSSVVWDRVPRPLLRVHSACELPWVEHDLRDVAPPLLAARIDEISREDRARGFDLRRAPLMRATLLRLGDEAWYLLWSHHHLLLDGWSLAIVLDEVFAGYAARAAGAPQALPKPRPYREYVTWLEQRDLVAAEAYWRTALGGVDGPTPLPLVEPRGGESSSRERSVHLDREATDALRALAKRRGLTLGTIVHGVWALLLSRYSGRNDIVFGVAVAGRPPELRGAETMVGLFINTLPLRVRVRDDVPLGAWLESVQSDLADALLHGHAPLARIQQWSSVPPGEPLFGSIVVSENYPACASASARLGPSVTVGTTRVVERTSYPLALMVELEERFALRVVYESAHLSDAAAEQLASHVAVLVSRVAAAIDAPVGELDLLTPPERTRAVGEWSGSVARPVAGEAVHRAVEAQARRDPDAVALVDGERTFTRGELNRAANRAARLLRARGVVREDVVALEIAASAELVIAMLATLKTGAAFLALDPTLPRARRDWIVADARPALVLAADELREALVDVADTDLDVEVHAAQAAYVIYTSGSTGTPKAVAGLHRGLLNRVRWMEDAFPYAPGEVCCRHIDTGFVDMVAEIAGPLVAGVPIVLIGPDAAHDPERLFDTLSAAHVSRITVVPSLLRALLDTPNAAARVPALRTWFVSGEVLPAALARDFARRLPGRRLVNLYGSSEISADVTAHEVEPGGDDGAPPPIGRPIANTRVFLVDDALRLVPFGVAGRVLVGGDGLARGYRNRADLTAERFIPDPFSGVAGARLYDTGDRARYRDDGSLEYAGRRDAEVKIRGQRVALEEIEAALASVDGVRAAAAVARSDAGGALRLEVFVVPDEAAPAAVRPLDFGLFYFADAAKGDAERYRQLLEGARFADTHGFSAVWIPERHFTTVGGNYPNPSVLAAALATITERISLRAGSVVLPLHHAARVAEEWAVVDNLSRGRVEIAFTSGWLPDDFAFAPGKFASRRTAMLDAVADVRALWRGDSVQGVNGHGEQIAIRTLPRPVQPELPLWITCTGDPEMFERAGALGANVLTGLLSQTVDQAAEKIELYRRARADHGFDPGAGRVAMMVHTFVAAEAAEALAVVREPLREYIRSQSYLLEAAVAHLKIVAPGEALAARHDVVAFALERYCRTASLIGSPESCLPMVQRLREIGVDEVACLVDFNLPADTMLAHLEDLDALRRRAASVASTGTERIRAALRDKLPAAMIPAHVGWIDALPLGETGKVDRRRLPRAAEHVRATGEPSAALTPLEARVVALWRDVLGTAHVGPFDDFFALGGHSLLAIRLLTAVREEFAVKLPLATLFTARTPAAFAAEIEPLLHAAPAPAVAIPRRDPALVHIPLAPAQQQIWLFEQLNPHSPAYNESSLLRLRGTLDADALRRAFDDLVQRHEALRARFSLRDGVPVTEFAASVAPSVEFTDLRALDPAQRHARATDAAIELARRPFDVTRAPLFRAALWRLGDDDQMLLVTLHLLIADGWSWRVLLRDLEELYAARRDARAPRLPALPIGYGDFALWQRARVEEPDVAHQLAYWMRTLADLPATAAIPFDDPLPRAVTGPAAAVERAWPAALVARLLEAPPVAGGTAFVAVLAAFQVALARASGRWDVIVGTPVAGRRHAESEELVGCFINTVTVRARLGADQTLREAFARVRDAALAAHDNAEVPFDRVSRAVRPDRAEPLVRALFVLTPAAPRALAGLRLTREPLADETAKFDVVLRVEERAEGWLARIAYDPALLRDTTAAALLDDVTSLLAQAGRDPDMRIGATEHDECLHELFERAAAASPEAVALVHGETALTYRDVNARADGLASVLRTRGIGPESIVALSLPRAPALVIAMLAVLKAGGAYLPLDPGAPPERLSAMLSAAELVLTDPAARAGRLDDIAVARVHVAETGEVAVPDAPDAPGTPPGRTRPANAAYVIFTSGSTGRPKGIVVEHRQIVAYTREAVRLLGGRPGQRFMLASSLAADLGYTVVFAALASGAALHLLPETESVDGRAFTRYVLAHEPAAIKILPSHLAALARSAGDALALPRTVVFGGETLDAAWLRALAERAPTTRFFNHYGPAEATVGALVHALSAATLAASEHTVSLGRPFRGVRVELLDGDGMRVAPGSAGEIAIGGAGVARGYLDEPARTAERFVPDAWGGVRGARLYLTGDRAGLRADGTFAFLGRRDRQVKIRGFRVEPEEVELALRRHSAVARCAVCARPAADGTLRLVAYLELADGARPHPDALRDALAATLPDYMVPTVFAVVPVLPALPSGKVDYARLPDPDDLSDRLVGEYAAPNTATERRVAAIWAAVLGTERVGVRSQFLALGGHSLLAVQIAARLREAFGIEIPARALFDYPDVAQLAAFVEAELLRGVTPDELVKLLGHVEPVAE